MHCRPQKRHRPLRIAAFHRFIKASHVRIQIPLLLFEKKTPGNGFLRFRRHRKNIGAYPKAAAKICCGSSGTFSIFRALVFIPLCHDNRTHSAFPSAFCSGVSFIFKQSAPHSSFLVFRDRFFTIGFTAFSSAAKKAARPQ